MRIVEARDLPDDPLDAAEAFHARIGPEIRRAIRGGDLPVALVFASADYTHRGWRLAAVQALAREAAPGRVNAVAGDDERAIAATVRWLAQAPGITGQLLAVD
jgi:hypothetical protein